MRKNKLNPTEYFKINPKTQYPGDVLFDTRALIINKEFWNSIRSDILDLMESGPVVLYQLGFNIGSGLGKKGCELADDWEVAFENLTDYCFDAGWGRIEIKDKEFFQGRLKRAIVIVHDNFFVQDRPPSKGPSCYFVAGLIAGITKGLLGDGYRSVELGCMAAGSLECRFGLLRQDRKDLTS